MSWVKGLNFFEHFYDLFHIFLKLRLYFYSFIDLFCCQRIKLPPAEVLEHIKSSASQEDKVFSTRCADRGVPQGLTWREWRYQQLLTSTMLPEFGPSQRTTFQVPHRRWLFLFLYSLLTRVRGFLFRIYSSKGSSSSGVAGPSSKKAEVSDTKVSDEVAGEGAEEHKDIEEGRKRAPEDKSQCKNKDDNSNWSWITEHDELHIAMKSGLALFGFVEGSIRFPPSFKWRSKASAGTFTNLDVLKGNDPLVS